MKSLAFGEILWDIFDKGQCLGGAPFNVACHLSRLGFESYILSALGTDSNGNEALKKIKAENVHVDYINIKENLPTGNTHIVLQDGIPDYEFNNPCAWDSIVLDSKSKESLLKTNWDIFCFGTLAQRTAESRNTLKSILPYIKARYRFFDVNLRKNFYSTEVFQDCLEYTDILKLNDDELPVLSKLLFPHSNSTISKSEALEKRDSLCKQLISKFNLSGILLTCGKHGSLAYFDNKTYTSTPSEVKVVDTVGAGDSLSAGFLSSLAEGKSVQASLNNGSKLADFVVSHEGALPEYDKNTTLTE